MGRRKAKRTLFYFPLGTNLGQKLDTFFCERLREHLEAWNLHYWCRPVPLLRLRAGWTIRLTARRTASTSPVRAAHSSSPTAPTQSTRNVTNPRTGTPTEDPSSCLHASTFRKTSKSGMALSSHAKRDHELGNRKPYSSSARRPTRATRTACEPSTPCTYCKTQTSPLRLYTNKHFPPTNKQTNTV